MDIIKFKWESGCARVCWRVYTTYKQLPDIIKWHIAAGTILSVRLMVCLGITASFQSKIALTLLQQRIGTLLHCCAFSWNKAILCGTWSFVSIPLHLKKIVNIMLNLFTKLALSGLNACLLCYLSTMYFGSFSDRIWLMIWKVLLSPKLYDLVDLFLESKRRKLFELLHLNWLEIC